MSEDALRCPFRSYPVERDSSLRPPFEYAGMRDEAPLVRVTLPNGREAWAVTRFAEVKQVLSDPGVSTDLTRPGFPRLTLDPPEVEGRRNRFHAGEFFNMDPPEHNFYRRMLIPEFSAKRVSQARPEIHRLIEELIDEMLAKGSPLDFAENFALPIPSLGVCNLLGLPYQDHTFFQPRIRARQLVDSTEVSRGFSEVRAYMTDAVQRATASPRDDLLGRLVDGRYRAGEVSQDEMVGMVVQLLIAAHETTANMILLGVVTLLDHPDQLSELRLDPTLWPAAIDELLRYHAIADGPAFARIATTDIPVGDQTIRSGDAIFALCASANHDEREFDEPEQFNIHRQVRQHLGFGYGVHQCLGQNLARAWLEIAFRSLFERIPRISLAVPIDELQFKTDAAIFGLDELPVAW